jgi:hypothetical protein
MNSLTQCKTALEYLRNAKSEFPLAAHFEEREVEFSYQTARNAIILAEAHIKRCLEEWTKEDERE